MKKRKWMSIHILMLFLALVMILSMTAMAEGNDIGDYKHLCSKCTFDEFKPSLFSEKHPDWLAMLPDHVQISRINMPVSHDAGCWNMAYGVRDLSRTQMVNIEEQLEYGTRVLDIRLGVFEADKTSVKDNPFKMRLHHAPKSYEIISCVCYDDEGKILRLDRVMEYIGSFLKNHPTETVVAYVTDHQIGNKEAVEAINKIADEYDVNDSSHDDAYFQNRTYSFLRYYKSGATVPELGEVRGKCVMIYVDNSLTSYENHCDKFGDEALYTKGKYIEAALECAPALMFYKNTNDKFCNQHWSAPNDPDPMVKTIGFDVNDIPYSGTLPGTAARYLNLHFGKHINLVEERRYGWIKLDYMTSNYCEKLLDQIIRTNPGTTMMHAGFYLTKGAAVPRKEDIKVFYQTRYGNVYVDLHDSDVLISKKKDDYIEFSFRNLSYYNTDGSAREYGIEIDDNVSIIKRKEESKDKVFEFNQTYTKSETGFSYDTLVKREVTNVYDLLVGSKDITFELDIDYFNTASIAKMIENAETLIENLGKLRIYLYSNGRIVNTIELVDYNHKISNTSYVAHEIKPLEGSANKCIVTIQNLPEYAIDGTAYDYRIAGFTENTYVNKIAKQVVTQKDDGDQCLTVIIFSGEKIKVEGSVTWMDGDDRYNNRTAAIDELEKAGIILDGDNMGPVTINEVTRPESGFDNKSEFSGEIWRFNREQKLVSEYTFALPETLLDGQYRLVPTADKHAFEYVLCTKTDLQVIVDENLEYEKIPSAEVTILENGASMVKITADQWDGNILTTAPEQKQWIVYPFEEKWLVTNQLKELLNSAIKKDQNDYEINVGYETDVNEKNEPATHIRVHCIDKSEHDYVSGYIQWHDGDLKIEHSSLYDQIRFRIEKINWMIGEILIIEDESIEKSWYDNFYKLTSGEMIKPVFGMNLYNLKGISELEGYEKPYSSSNTWIYTKTVEINGSIELQGNMPVDKNSLKIYLVQDGKKLSLKPDILEETDDSAYKYQFKAPISDRNNEVYRYKVIAECGENYPVTYNEPKRDPQTGNVTADVSIYNFEEKGTIRLPVQLQVKGNKLKQKEYRFTAKGLVDGYQYEDELILSKDNAFSSAFEIKNYKAGVYEFEIYQVSMAEDDIKYDTHISKVKVFTYYGQGPMISVQVLDDQGETTGTDTSVFVNYPAGPKLSFEHETISYVPKEMEYSKAVFEYDLTKVDESGRRIVIDTVSVQDTGDRQIQEQRLSFEALDIYEEGSYTYYLSARTEEASGWVYDTAEYPIEVTLTYQDDEPRYEIKYNGESSLTITHTYSVAQCTIPSLELILDGAAAQKGEVFTFVAEPTSAGETLMTSISEAGSCSFDTLTFYEPCERIYEIRQIRNSQNPRWIYDESIRRYEISVTRDSYNRLRISAKISRGELKFTNKYSVLPVSISVRWEGDKEHKEDRPETLEFSLFREEKLITTASIAGSDANEWKGQTTASVPWYRFNEEQQMSELISYELRVNDEDTKLSKYNVEEVSGDAKNGYTVLCSYRKPLIYKDVSVSVLWDDSENLYGTRPEQVTAKLNVVAGEIAPPEPLMMKSSSNWTVTYQNLQMNEYWQNYYIYDIVYEPVPDPEILDNYSMTFETDENGNYVLTYKLKLNDMSDCVKATGYEGIYDGQAHGILLTLSGEAEGAEIRYGTSKDDCTQTVSPMYTEAGSYEVFYRVAKNGYKDVSGSVMVVIRNAGKQEQKLTVSSEMTTLLPGGTTQIKAESFTAAGEKIDLVKEHITYSYTSSDENIATVDQNGLVTAVAAGTVTITVSASEGHNYLSGWNNVTLTVAFMAQIEDINKKLTMKYSKAGITVTWERISQADGYEIYLAPYKKRFDTKTPALTVEATKKKAVIKDWNGKKLKKNMPYKAYVKAFRMIGEQKIYLTESMKVYAAYTKHPTYTNAKKVKVSKKTLKIRKGKKTRIKAKLIKEKTGKRLIGKVKKFRYWSKDPSIATVNARGVVRGKQKGSTVIYVMAENGVKTTVKVTIK